MGFSPLTTSPPVVAYLDDLLSGRYSDEEIPAIWHRMPADIYFTDARGAVKVLSLVRDLLKTHPQFKPQ